MYNFNPGPSVLPDVVRERLSAAIEKYKDSQIGILETSHRSTEFQELLREGKELLEDLLELEGKFHILF